MTIFAIAGIDSSTQGISVNGDGSSDYTMNIRGMAFNDQAGPTNNPGGFELQPVRVSTSFSAKKADSVIRQAIAAQILSQLGLVIDPDDIYIPLS